MFENTFDDPAVSKAARRYIVERFLWEGRGRSMFRKVGDQFGIVKVWVMEGDLMKRVLQTKPGPPDVANSPSAEGSTCTARLCSCRNFESA